MAQKALKVGYFTTGLSWLLCPFAGEIRKGPNRQSPALLFLSQKSRFRISTWVRRNLSFLRFQNFDFKQNK
jgi:hypothetical protein